MFKGFEQVTHYSENWPPYGHLGDTPVKSASRRRTSGAASTAHGPIHGRYRRRHWTAGPCCRLASARHDFVRPFAALLSALARFRDFGAIFAPDPEGRRLRGTLPIRGSLAKISSQARSAASSKSGASTGRTCQPVTFFANT